MLCLQGICFLLLRLSDLLIVLTIQQVILGDLLNGSISSKMIFSKKYSFFQ